jgi:hypothetical protein
MRTSNPTEYAWCFIPNTFSDRDLLKILQESGSVSFSGSESEDLDAEKAIFNSAIVTGKIKKKTNQNFRCFLGNLLPIIIFLQKFLSLVEMDHR